MGHYIVGFYFNNKHGISIINYAKLNYTQPQEQNSITGRKLRSAGKVKKQTEKVKKKNRRTP